MDLDEEQLILEIQSRPVIFNRKHHDYKKNNKREEAWNNIANILGYDVAMCKRRWRSLRDVFIKNYKHMKTKPGDSTRDKRRIWNFYNHMEFLIPYIELKEPADNYSYEISTQCLEEYIPAMDDEEKEVDIISSQIEESSCMGQESLTDSMTWKRKRKTCDLIEERLLKIINEKPDADEQFLLSLLPSLKRLDEQKKTVARIQLQQVMYNIEFGSERKHSYKYSAR